jgi:hypothetical protein
MNGLSPKVRQRVAVHPSTSSGRTATFSEFPQCGVPEIRNTNSQAVIPAKAGIQSRKSHKGIYLRQNWMPAFAGMTVFVKRIYETPH